MPSTTTCFRSERSRANFLAQFSGSGNEVVQITSPFPSPRMVIGDFSSPEFLSAARSS